MFIAPFQHTRQELNEFLFSSITPAATETIQPSHKDNLSRRQPTGAATHSSLSSHPSTPRRSATPNKNASGGQGARPLHPMHLFLSSHPSAPPQAFRRGPGKGCRLFDRARHRLLPGRQTVNAPPLPKAQGREALRGPRGSSGSPCPARDGTRLPPLKRKNPRQGGDSSHRTNRSNRIHHLLRNCLLSPIRMVIFSLSRYSNTGMANLRVNSVKSRKSCGPISWLDSKKPRTRPMMSSMAVLA